MPTDQTRLINSADTAEISVVPTRTQPLSGVISAGRSGSSWLGSLLSSSPEVAYRFEPFHREGHHSATADGFLARARVGDAQPEDAGTPYEALRQTNLAVERPPFFNQPWVRRYQHQLWGASRAIPLGDRLYDLISSTPPPGTNVVFKDVTLEALIGVFLETLQIPVIYLVRHPCAAVLSDWRGQEAGVMSRGRHQDLRGYLQYHGALELLQEVEPNIDDFNHLQTTAVLWRCDAEMALGFLNESGAGCTVIYEELCDNTEAEMKRIFRYLGLALAAQTVAFIEELESLESTNPRSFDARDPYFSVQRSPRLQRDRWKTDIANEQRRQIEAIVEPSWAFETLAALAPWD